MNESENVTCHPPEGITDTRFALIVLCGTPVACIGTIVNSLLLVAFARMKNRAASMGYLVALAAIDCMICAQYIFLFGLDAVGIYYKQEGVWRLWHGYVMLLLTLSRICQLATVYIVLFATLDKYGSVAGIRSLRFLSTHSKAVIFGTVFIATSLRLPTYWEFYVVQIEDCVNDFEDLQFAPILEKSYFYKNIYNLWIMHIVQKFLPFLLLIFLNFLLIWEMRKSLRKTGSASNSTAAKPENQRQDGRNSEVQNGNGLYSPRASQNSTTTTTYRFRAMRRRTSRLSGLSKYLTRRMKLKSTLGKFFAMVTSYLLCNSLDVFIKMLEHAGSSILYTPDHYNTELYTICTDMISLLFMLNSFLRPFIYWAFDPDFRREICRIFFTSTCLAPEKNESRRTMKRSRSVSVGSAEQGTAGRGDARLAPIVEEAPSPVHDHSAASAQSQSEEEDLALACLDEEAARTDEREDEDLKVLVYSV